MVRVCVCVCVCKCECVCAIIVECSLPKCYVNLFISGNQHGGSLILSSFGAASVQPESEIKKPVQHH